MIILNRFLFIALVALGLSPVVAFARDAAPGNAVHGVTVYYFGSKECPYCRSFVKYQLEEMREQADAAGVHVVVRETARLRDLRKPVAFADLETVWSSVVRDSGLAVPAFGLVVDGKFVDSRAGDWRKLMREAVEAASEPLKSASR